MNTLLNLNIDNDVIEEIISHNGKSILTDIDGFNNNIRNNLMLLKELGINCINELLIYKMDIFFINYPDLKQKIVNLKDLGKFVDKVNEDFFNIDEIM